MPFRLLRAAVFAAVTVSASALLHVWAGGPVPRPSVVAGVLAVVFAGAFAAGGRERGFAVLTPLCLAAQWGLHECFLVGAAPVGHDHGAELSMWLVHFAAALAQASWLARGEAALAALLDLLTLFVARVLLIVLARAFGAARPRRPLARPRSLRSRALLVSAISLRGPPALA